MPWLEILLLIIAVYLLIIAVKGIRDFVIWYREGREFARERERLKALRRQQKSDKMHMPALRERPPEASKPPSREAKPRDRPGH